MSYSNHPIHTALDIMETFLHEPLLPSLDIDCRNPRIMVSEPIPDITKLCLKQGCRRVCVYVFGDRYLS